VIKRNMEPHGFEAVTHPPPDVFWSNAEVLAAKGHIIANALKNYLIFGVLQHQANAAPGIRRPHAIDSQCAGNDALVIPQHAGETGEEGALTRAGGPQK